MIGVRAGVPRQYLQAGAGRTIDVLYPTPGARAQSIKGAAATQAVMARGGGNAAIATQFSATGTQQWDVSPTTLGPCINITPPTVAGQQHAIVLFSGPAPAYNPSPSGIVPGPEAVTRIIATMEVPVAVDDTMDIGLVFPTASTNAPVTGARGFSIHLGDAARAQLVVCDDARVVHRATLTSDGFTCAAMHTYEVRIFEATATDYARIEVWIDGVKCPVPAMLATWGPGGLLPSQSPVGGNRLGYAICALNGQAVGAGSLLLSRARWIAGPSLNDVL